ncbi:MAG: 4Fe-4S dicluster domain-containing protein [Chloroflexi bacterium]|nr:4Fe-4S dicluster domain-containing protein [Chloroflexota bacterium]
MLNSDLTQQIRDKARELLESKAAECVIGYETGSDGAIARPAFIYSPDGVERLVFDDTCTHNLASYLVNRKGKATAVVLKACDARSLNVLLQEKQVARDKVYAIGVACDGIRQAVWGRPKGELQDRCKACQGHTPPIYDVLIGQPTSPDPPAPSDFSRVAEMEAKTPEERLAFWQRQFARCIRCYACRQICFGCYCQECFVERLDPEWTGIRVAPAQNQMYHIIRAFHLAGRCIACDECQRACPVDIPLSLLNRKLEEETLEMFGHRSGLSAEAQAPMATFRPEELE